MVLPTGCVKVRRSDDIEENTQFLRPMSVCHLYSDCATVLCCTNGTGVRIKWATCVLDE